MPEEVLNTRSIYTQENDIRKLKKKKTWKKKVTAKTSLAKHGNATDPQLYSYLSLGTLFWGTIMLIGNLNITFKFKNFTKTSEFAFSGEITRRDDFSDFNLQ